MKIQGTFGKKKNLHNNNARAVTVILTSFAPYFETQRKKQMNRLGWGEQRNPHARAPQTTNDSIFFLFHFYPWPWRGKIGKRKKPTSNQTKLQYSLVLASCRLLALSLGLERRTLAPQEIEMLNSAMLGKPHLIFFFIFSLLLRAVGFGRNWQREREKSACFHLLFHHGCAR